MAYQLYYPWRKNPRLMQLIFTEAVSVADLESALTQAAQLMEESQAALHIVLGFSTAESLPQEMVKYLPRAPIVGHPRCGYCVFVKPNEFISFAAKILNHQTKTPIEFSPDEEDAWEFFNQMGIC